MSARRKLSEMRESAAAIGGGGMGGCVEEIRLGSKACAGGPSAELSGIEQNKAEREFWAACDASGSSSEAGTPGLAIMNLAIRGFEEDIGKEHADTFRKVQHPDLRADHVLANPPCNDSDWFRKDDDVRWQFGVPPKGNANFAWVKHFIHHLAPQGVAGVDFVCLRYAAAVLANGSMSSNQSGEGDIRRAVTK